MARLVVETLDVGARVTLRGRRRVFAEGGGRPTDALPSEWRALLAQWLKRAPRAKWPTLLADAGHARIELARQLKDWLLDGGWITVEETRSGASWDPLWIEFRAPQDLRTALGLADPAQARSRWQARRQTVEAGPLRAHLHALDALPPARALERVQLLEAAEQWRADGRHGTRRDFAQFARGATKAISEAEWRWLQAQLDLDAAGIARHAPTLALRAPLVLVTGTGEIDLAAAPDFVGITVDTLAQARAVRGQLPCWRVVENRSSFERVARAYGGRDAVVWVPGFAPGWWVDAMRSLLAVAPAPALVACDPDPSGIEIAVAVGALWEAAGLAWQPWQMSSEALLRLPVRRPLAAFDRARLDVLLAQPLPAVLAELAQAMNRCGQKGEQEGLL